MSIINLYGCSFTENLMGLNVMNSFTPLGCEVVNYGKRSSSNSTIYKKIEKTAQPNSILVIQWSALTRPMDDDWYLTKSDNALYDLLERWYLVLDKTQELAIKRNLQLVQYIGWSMWKDDELNDYHRQKLNSYGITWFKSSECLDIIESNCVQLQTSEYWIRYRGDGLFHWDDLTWGGWSEWVRENVEMSKRYMGRIHKGDNNIDPHPSAYASKRFIEEVVLGLINEKLKK